jgi:phage shock protein A
MEPAMSAQAGPDTGLLGEVRRRRAELRSTMVTLELALASAAGEAASWTAQLRKALGDLTEAFGEHVAVTEGHGGLYRELAEQSPRLAHAVDRLAREHSEINRRLEELAASIAAPEAEADIPQLRQSGTDLLVVLMRHRQRGADLVFEAYDLDIGGET